MKELVDHPQKTSLDEFLIKFLAGLRGWPKFEQGLLTSLQTQEWITPRQRFFLWRMIAKYTLPEINALPDHQKEIIELANFLINGADEFYRGKWATHITNRLSANIQEALADAAKEHYVRLATVESQEQEGMRNDHEA